MRDVFKGLSEVENVLLQPVHSQLLQRLIYWERFFLFQKNFQPSRIGRLFLFCLNNNIHTTFDKILTRADKETLLKQKGMVIWLTGLSGSGKTTIAAAVERKLNGKGKLTQILDGDNIRAGINNNLSFSEEDRKENIRRIAEVAKLFKDCGIITICCFVSPTNEIRDQARKIVGKHDFVSVYISTPLEECERRDVKGLYAKARKGEIKDFTGVNAPFEIPEGSDLEIDTSKLNLEQSVNKLYEFIIHKISNTNEQTSA